jgi:hypothetical protein
VCQRRRRRKWRRGLEGRLGAAEDRRRESFEEGGAARQSRERRRPRVAVAGGSADGGCGCGAGLVCGRGLLPRIRRAALLSSPLRTFFPTCISTATVLVGKSPGGTVTRKLNWSNLKKPTL